MPRWNHASFEAQTEGFVFENSNREHLCLEHGNLHFIAHRTAESGCSRASASTHGGSVSSRAGSAPSSAQTQAEAEADFASDASPPHLHNARVEDILRGFAKDSKALAHTLRDFTVRTLLAMNDLEFQAMFDMFERSELSVADFFALKVGVREAKKLLLTIQF